MNRPLCAALIALTALTACDDDQQTVDYVDAGAETPRRSDCVETDFTAQPLQGPAFTDGRYSGATEAPLVASSTVLYLADRPGAPQRFEELMLDIRPELAAADGLLGVAFGSSMSCGAYRTLALWRDPAAMMAFVGTGAHLAAMSAAGEVADRDTRTVHWTFDPAGAPLTWEEGMTRTAAAPPFTD